MPLFLIKAFLMKKQRALKDYSGQKFNRLTAVKLVLKDDKWNDHIWLFSCDCGNSKNIRIKSVRSNHTKSCGCYKSELLAESNKTHGRTKENLLSYMSWKDMNQRCFNKKNKDYKNYGGRGIDVCERWKNFDNFFVDLGERQQHQTLDRIDVNQGYNPFNCKWSTAEEQANNKRNNFFLNFEGKKYSITQLSKKVGVNRKTIKYRLSIGLSLEKSIEKIDYRKCRLSK